MKPTITTPEELETLRNTLNESNRIAHQTIDKIKTNDTNATTPTTTDTSIVTLSESVEIYIPSTYNGNEPAEPALIATVTDAARCTLATLTGGVTETLAQGGYIDQLNQYIGEPIRILTSFTQDAEAITQQMINLGNQVKSALRQESVLIRINGKVLLLYCLIIALVLTTTLTTPAIATQVNTTPPYTAYAPDGITRTDNPQDTTIYRSLLPIVAVNRGIDQETAPDNDAEINTPAKLDQPIQLDPLQNDTCNPGRYQTSGPHPCPNNDHATPNPTPTQPKTGKDN